MRTGLVRTPRLRECVMFPNRAHYDDDDYDDGDDDNGFSLRDSRGDSSLLDLSNKNKNEKLMKLKLKEISKIRS